MSESEEIWGLWSELLFFQQSRGQLDNPTYFFTCQNHFREYIQMLSNRKAQKGEKAAEEVQNPPFAKNEHL